MIALSGTPPEAGDKPLVRVGRMLRVLIALCLAALLGPSCAVKLQLPLKSIKLPRGFSIALYTKEKVAGPRQLALSHGTNSSWPNASIVYIGTSNETKVYALVDREGTGAHVQLHELLTGQNQPNGVVWHNNSLYVAEVGQITRYDNPDAFALAGKALPKGHVISRAMPANQTDHQVHVIGVGPDNLLYFNQGAETNTGPCHPYGKLGRCTISRMRLDGTGLETFAAGVRNSVGFDWHPATGELWATNNARQFLPPTDREPNRPDDGLYHIPNKGRDFGFPYCHWQGNGPPEKRSVNSGHIVLDNINLPPHVDNVNDTADFRAYCLNPGAAHMYKHSGLHQANADSLGSSTGRLNTFVLYAANNVKPAQSLGPHVAALGMRFYTAGGGGKSQFPAAYDRNIIMAQHGSGARTPAVGYRLMSLSILPDGTIASYSVFAEGWLTNPGKRKFWGRPVDVLQMKDGSLVVSDNWANAIYRISYRAVPGP